MGSQKALGLPRRRREEPTDLRHHLVLHQPIRRRTEPVGRLSDSVVATSGRNKMLSPKRVAAVAATNAISPDG